MGFFFQISRLFNLKNNNRDEVGKRLKESLITNSDTPKGGGKVCWGGGGLFKIIMAFGGVNLIREGGKLKEGLNRPIWYV